MTLMWMGSYSKWMDDLLAYKERETQSEAEADGNVTCFADIWTLNQSTG